MAKVSFPARCAVAVVCGEHLVSQVYPASVPIEVFIDNVVELLNDELKRRGLAGLESGIGYELHKANGVRLDITKTLDELGVEDGATLALVPAAQGESFEPQYESLSTGLARVAKSLFEPVTVQTAAHTALAILTMIGATVLGLAVRQRISVDSLTPTLVTGTLGLLSAGGAVAVWRWWPQRTDMLDGFGWLAVPLLAVALGAGAPGRLGAAHLFITALAVGVLTCGMAAATRRHVNVASTVVTLCGLGGIVAAARMWWPIPAQWLGMCTLVALLLLLTMAPTIALWVARIRPPYFGSITGRDLFRRSAGLPVDAVSPVNDAAESAEDDVNPDTTPRGAQIAAAAVRANHVLTGICVAAGLALPAAVWATLMPGRDRGTAAAVLAGLFVVIFVSRGRAFADKRQAVALVCGAAAAACVGVVKYVGHEPAASGQPLVWGVLALAAFGGAGLIAALLVPVTRFTPLVRMTAEWLEIAAIIAALPLAAWIGGLFTWVRMR
ncbi:type VII secretion integral membrane protein EccD [Mycobacterium angelicum]|uniref:Type VII secretion integral membrane protein EccD n=1 Tax=Mycobacterium angelicum TaxID=470074 RepID=A0A1W9ZZ49_MYCAN|nr:type VII secretion integral membrane protein EccD [Mycobacterium angelicum]MCV7198956.1 type VII secretion integral membrane protein EccD [Mycobacterium angelicum]ORA22928.1 type VII secretion integral membrane protein EccD [Mycobacterium angelicum]